MPVTPGSSITRRQAMRMAKNATNVRYGGQETGVNQQIAQSQQLGRDQAGWYQQYLDALKGYQTDTQNRAAADERRRARRCRTASARLTRAT
jgi:hypothetical protein